MEATLQNAVFLLYDVTGRLMYATPVSRGINDIQVENLNVGLYFWEVRNHGGRLQSGKVVKTHE
jgi:hypothetical protein